MLTSGIRDGCGLLYRVKGSHETVSTLRLFDQEPRVKVVNGYAKIFGATEDLGLFKFIEHCLQLFKLFGRVLRNALFELRTLYWANVYSSLKGTSCTIITSYLGIKYAVVLVQQLLEFEAELIW